MITVPVLNAEGSDVGRIKLDESVFNDRINLPSVHHVVTAFMSQQRKGLASTKTRGEVSGGGKKPWKQKGTGRARAGSTRSPLWRHGGVVFGPHPRDFGFDVPRKMKDNALRSALSAKAASGNLIVIEQLELAKGKTAEMAGLLGKLNIAGDSVTIVVDKAADTVKRASRNIPCLTLQTARNLNTYEVLAPAKLVVTKDALNELTGRLRKEQGAGTDKKPKS